jgi:DNA modification methylase
MDRKTRKRLAKLIAMFGSSNEGERHLLFCDDFRDVDYIPADSIDYIITDPPYAREYLSLFGQLAERAA